MTEYAWLCFGADEDDTAFEVVQRMLVADDLDGLATQANAVLDLMGVAKDHAEPFCAIEIDQESYIGAGITAKLIPCRADGVNRSYSFGASREPRGE